MTSHTVERNAELGVIDDCIRAVQAGRGGVLVLSGPEGSGRSRLVESACERAALSGVQVTRARTSAAGGGFPFAAAVELLEPLVAEDREGAWRGAAMFAAPLFQAPGGGEELWPRLRGRALHGLYQTVANVTEAGSLVFVVDEVQWVDDPSLAFLHHLAQRIDQVPVLLVMTLRTDLPGAGSGRLSALLSLRGVRTLALSPLTADAVGELVRAEYFAEATEPFCAEAGAVTGRNPYLLHELLRAVREAGRGADVGVLRATIPDGVRRLAAARLQLAGDGAASLAGAIAVLGEADLTALGRVAGLDGRSGTAAIGVLVASGIATLDHQTVRFVHPLVGRAIEAELACSERLALHAAAAKLLAERGADAETVAAHLLDGAPTGEDWAMGQLEAAAQHARHHGAPGTAATYLRRAIEETSSDERRGDVLMALGEAEAIGGDSRSLGDFAQARVLSHDPHRRAEAAYGMALAHRVAGRVDDAREAFDAGIADCHDPTEPLYLRLLAGRAATVHLGRLPGGASGGDLRRAAGTSASLRLAIAGTAAVRAGAPREEAIALAQAALEDPLLAEEGPGSPAFQAAIEVLLWTGGDAGRPIDAAVAAAAQSGSTLDQATMHYCRAVLRWQRGELRGAVDDARAALAAVPAGWGLYAPAARAILALALLETGAADVARDALGGGMLDGRRPASLADAWLLEATASIELADGDPPRAASMFERLGRAVEVDLQILSPALVPWRSKAAHAHLRAGDQVRAVELAAVELDAARRGGWERPIGIAQHALGCATDGAAGLALLDGSARLLERAGARVEEASTRVDLGAALRGAGRSGAAVEQLQAAITIALSCGAGLVARRAQIELRAARGRPPRGSRRPLALTPGEDRVVDLVLTGLTNREVAEQLFVSVKAVEWHLGNAYGKLGVSSRAELRELVGRPHQDAGAAG